MSGSKIVIKKDSTIVIKLKSGQEINKRETQLINSGGKDEFLKFKTDRKALTYDCNGLIPLTDYLRMNQMSKKFFAHILLAVVGAIKSCEVDYFSLRLLTLSLQYTMIDPGTWHVYFLYIPVQPFESPGSLKEILNEIIQYSVFDTSEDTDYIQDYIRMINSGAIVQWQTVEEYANGLVAQLQSDSPQYERRCYRCNTALGDDELVCPGCGMCFQRPLSFNEVPEAGIDNPKEAHNVALAFGGWEELPSTKNEAEISGSMDDTGIICVFKPAGAQADTACLVSAKSRLRNVITKTPFVVGKLQWETDLCLPENTVSRKHASFHCENGEYYVSDLGSTNGTFLNGKRLESLKKHKLSQGDIVRFACEEFIFENKKKEEN